MTTLTDAAGFASDSRARRPLQAAIVTTAIAVAAESDTTPNHTDRLALSALVLRSPAAMLEPFLWAMSSNATVVDKWTASDTTGAIGDFAYVLTTLWDAMARAVTLAPTR